MTFREENDMLDQINVKSKFANFKNYLKKKSHSKAKQHFRGTLDKGFEFYFYICIVLMFKKELAYAGLLLIYLRSFICLCMYAF